jgi:transposase
VIDATHLGQLDAQQLRESVLSLMGERASQAAQIERKDREIAFKQDVIDKITHEMAVLKRLKFAAKSEAFSAEQKSLLEETIAADLEALERELAAVQPAPKDAKSKNPNASRCPRACRAGRSTTSPRARHANAAAR